MLGYGGSDFDADIAFQTTVCNLAQMYPFHLGTMDEGGQIEGQFLGLLSCEADQNISQASGLFVIGDSHVTTPYHSAYIGLTRRGGRRISKS